MIPIEAEDLISEPATTSVIDTSASETVAETLDRDPTSTDPIVADTPPANNESTSEEASATLEEKIRTEHNGTSGEHHRGSNCIEQRPNSRDKRGLIRKDGTHNGRDHCTRS
ncbi:MAG: hypothetical protein IPI91_18655 [Flavobacteriales bacterium]|nr:hypothetical protein [Flavobacteriales bacterium]